MTILGDLASPTFLPWLARHARRLGLEYRQLNAAAERVELTVQGQPDLIDALEVGCLLGPFDVWVDTIERHSADGYIAPARKHKGQKQGAS